MQCLTPPAVDPANPGKVDILVRVNYKTVSCSSCDFEYKASRTPMIDFMVPAQAIAGSEIAFRGILRGKTHDLYNDGRIGSETVEIPDIHEILLPGVGVPYSATGTFNVSSVLGYDNSHGDGEPVLVVDKHYGKAGFEWTANTYKLDGTAYKFGVVADV